MLEALLSTVGFVLRAVENVLTISPEIIVEVVGYLTAKILIPIISFGTIRVQKFTSSETGFNSFGFKREPRGTLLCSVTAAGWLGVLMWVLFFVAAYIRINSVTADATITAALAAAANLWA
ncbi:hypothetical protein [Hoeflea sp. TYP-13]|uniref:hypothetical protein n=1 Tax=Hoeflea sp. TYP-13 TaxID=3230023 RepID=UPI0034C64BBF